MQTKEEREKKLTELMVIVGKAHHEYEQSKLNGETDENWADWYAEYLLENKINEYFEEELTKDDLSESLINAAAEHEESNSNLEWQQFFAKFLLYDFT